MLEYIKNMYYDWNHQESVIVPVIIPPKKDKTCALTYHSDFVDVDEDTNICEYKEALVCQEKNNCTLIEEYMKLSEVRINKHIYFHDQAGNAKTYVHNINSNGGTVYVNLSIKE